VPGGGKVYPATIAIPRHEIFRRAILTIVDAVRSQYLGKSIVYMGRYDSGSKWIFCTTGPYMLSAVAREVFSEEEQIQEHAHAHLQHEHDSLSAEQHAEHARDLHLQPGDANFTYTYTLYARDFHAFGGQFKPVWSDPKKHYMHRMHHHHIPLLKEYGGNNAVLLEGRIITADGKELFVVEHGQRRGFRDWDAFLDNQFNLRKAHMMTLEELQKIPLNETVVTSEEAPARIAARDHPVAVPSKHRVCVPPNL
jgi:hypothetical protein